MKKLTNNSFSKQKGFTLIELVVVIVILGILAATAVPKFIDLTGDARTSVMKGVQGSISSAVNLAHAKALVVGSLTEIEIGTKFYALVNGFPAVAAAGDFTGTGTGNGLGVASLIELEDGTDIEFDTGVFTHSGATDTLTCTLTYANAADSETPPVIEAVLTGC
jgi:MSHA pilin protein MshA